MAAAASSQQPTPERFFSSLNAYEQTEALKTAVELELFTAIAEGNTSAATIAKRCQASERGTEILCNFLTIHGFLDERGNAVRAGSGRGGVFGKEFAGICWAARWSLC